MKIIITFSYFNFKFREKFTSWVSKIREAINSVKFLNIIETEKLDWLEWRMRDELEKILIKLKSKDVWNIQLFVISNENFKFEKDENIKRLEGKYGLELINIWLTEISDFISIRPEPINAEIILDKDAIMSFTEDSLSSSKSYIIRLPLSEIVRITCNNKEFRNQYNLEDYSKLSCQKLDFSVLFDNVRWFVTKSKYNNNITETLKNEPNKFFIYNNWLTFIVSLIKTEPVSWNKKIKIKLENLQVVNWWQTLRSIHNFNSLDIKNIETNLSDAEILLRIFNVWDDNSLNNKIAEYTNSQNAISSIDLKSLRSEQLEIEQYLHDCDILYIRKSWDTWNIKKVYTNRISMEKLWKILFSLYGFPQKASNQKKAIFDKYYNDLFVKDFHIDKIKDKILNYFYIKNEYIKVDLKVSEQKIFYILYIEKNTDKLSINDIIEQFEICIHNFKTEKDLSDARKLIKNDFKDFIDTKFNIN